MTPDSKRFLHPEAIRRIGRLEIRARHVVEGFMSGLHRSPYFGQSIEFLQHRQYTPGDDLRHVDWKVWAKQDRLYVKQFEEDASMRTHAAGRRLGEHAVRLGAAQQVRVRGDGGGEPGVPAAAAARRGGVHRVRRGDPRPHAAAEHAGASGVDRADARRQRAAQQDRPRRRAARDRRGEPAARLMVVFSDLLGDVDSTLRGLRLLRQRGHDVLVLHVMDDDELDFPFDGPTRFEGLELPDHLNCNPRALREGYLEAVEQFLAALRHGCARDAVDYALIRTSQPLDAALAAFLSRRLAARRGRAPV